MENLKNEIKNHETDLLKISGEAIIASVIYLKMSTNDACSLSCYCLSLPDVRFPFAQWDFFLDFYTDEANSKLDYLTVTFLFFKSAQL